MRNQLKKLLKNWRIWVLVLAVVIGTVAISPRFGEQGIAIRGVERGSPADLAGMHSPVSGTKPVDRERIESINGQHISSLQDYLASVSDLQIGDTVSIQTSQGFYQLKVLAGNETNVSGPAHLGLQVTGAASSNILKGLDIQGGTRVLLKPEEQLAKEDLDFIVQSLQQRLNVFGLSDVTVKPASDLSGGQFILVEIAGVNENEVRELITQQGKFEAKIQNKTVFSGGRDIVRVCRTSQGECFAGISPRQGCQEGGDGWICAFEFGIVLSPDAAQKQADATRSLAILSDGGGRYLSEPIVFYLDDVEVDSLSIDADLRGKASTNIQITGSGTGSTRNLAIQDALDNMKQLQTLLITGSLPVKLDIIRADTISPLLGEQFLNNAISAGGIAVLVVALILYGVYRKLRIAIPILFTALLEIYLVLGVAVIIRQNIDLAAIAGIIAAVGTGVDDQIVITDEALNRGGREDVAWRDRIKRAFFIIFGSYFSVIVSMTPLLFAGAGLLRGFAITTMLGVSIGVFITRPAYAKIVEILIGED